jgi:hypothetical protein
VGDCDDNRHVTVDELLQMDAALGDPNASICATALPPDDTRSTVDRILRAINDALIRFGS